MIDIRAIAGEDIEQFSAALGSVISERLYLASTELPQLEGIRKFVENNIDKGYPQIVAVHQGKVIGWCDIVANSPAEFAHVGRLGMGVIADYRGQGIGKRLITSCLERAARAGFEKVSLQVYSDNTPAIRLYEQSGFEREGQLLRARKIDNSYQNIVLMGKFL